MLRGLWLIFGVLLSLVGLCIGVVQPGAAYPAPAQGYDELAINASETLTSTVYLPLILKPELLPIIHSFTANPVTIAPGGSALLLWEVQGATSVSIGPGVGPVSGFSTVVYPTTTTDFVLTTANSSGAVTAQVRVSVIPGSSDTGQLYLPSLSNAKSPSLLIDPNGGLHIALDPASAASVGGYPVQYAYCASQCNQADHWALTSVGEAGWLGGYSQLALTPDGKPRLMWFQQTSLSGDGTYYYAACDQNCTNPTNWVQIALVEQFVGPVDTRYFTLDPQGRPRFVYTDIDTGTGHTGTFYVYCDHDCASPANWFETRISGQFLWLAFTLAYDGFGHLHMLYSNGTDADHTLLAYARCDMNCKDAAKWLFTTLYDLGNSGYDFSMRVDPYGRPRVALYPGYFGPGEVNDRLYYAWCDELCTDAIHWNRHDLGLPEDHGVDVDLILDAQFRPRLAFATNPFISDEIRYAWCNTNCESTTALWQTQQVETAEAWYLGYTPSLALDAAGNPRLAYNAKQISTGVQLVRLALFPQP
jgi:hypothetical protein